LNEELKPFSRICEERSDEQMGNGYCSRKEKDSFPVHQIKKSRKRFFLTKQTLYDTLNPDFDIDTFSRDFGTKTIFSQNRG
jgi:hypothetical protein